MTVIRYSNDELVDFKNLLEQKLLESTLKYNSVLLQLNEPIVRDAVSTNEDNDEYTRKDLLYSESARLKRYLDNLKSALLRIDNKTYGICIVTGTIIPKQRLLAVPHTTINTEAKLQHMRLGA